MTNPLLIIMEAINRRLSVGLQREAAVRAGFAYAPPADIAEEEELKAPRWPIEAYQAQINKTLETLARISETPAYFLTEDGRVRIEPPEDRGFEWREWRTISWRDPEPITLELRGVALETMEILFGGSLIPLCERQIPAEGTE